MRIPLEQWRPVVHDRINSARERSAVNLLLSVAPLAVTGHPRYQPVTGKTYCNIFLWDATCALDAEIPHWYGEAIGAGGAKVELSALGIIGWLRAKGQAQGWHPCSADEARESANIGCPTVVTWENQGRRPTGERLPSHVALLLPSPRSGPQLIAQAGAECLFGAPLERGFGEVGPLFYFTHD